MTQIWNEKIALLLYYFQNFICSYKQQVVHRVFYLMESFALLYLQLEDHSETFAQFMQTMTQRKQTPAKEQDCFELFPNCGTEELYVLIEQEKKWKQPIRQEKPIIHLHLIYESIVSKMKYIDLDHSIRTLQILCYEKWIRKIMKLPTLARE